MCIYVYVHRYICIHSLIQTNKETSIYIYIHTYTCVLGIPVDCYRAPSQDDAEPGDFAGLRGADAPRRSAPQADAPEVAGRLHQ